ncbi:hypothetical protein C8F04DRAFT_1183010 [Mycena alexandri]|nr:hypothetical protein C8F04DRAFT_1187012 [Mycena alexandri]KAJ7030936.1 hypothetical protein C8F04DRAFT_1186399 [Mycena alexandri]KAJ7034749.1 hypothetical protein C8F04DRAFT_1183010 [Mycena alexandri]
MERLKGLAAREDRFMSKTELLELTLRYGMPFKLFVEIAEACDDEDEGGDKSLTMCAIYEPGYVDPPIGWTGRASGKLVYYGSLHWLLDRPHAFAFLFAGGLLKFIAETFRPDLIYRLAQGPSLQTARYNQGESRKLPLTGRKGYFVAERISGHEIEILIGTIPGSHAGAEKTLWPHPSLLEKQSKHWRGYLSQGARAALCNLRDDMLLRDKFTWRSESEWKGYLRKGANGLHAPLVVPSEGDFNAGRELMARSFPLDWDQAPLANLVLPEKFDPHYLGR